MVGPLTEYIVAHTERGECQCGACIDKGPDREAPNHSVNVHFFWVARKGEPKLDEFRDLLEKHYPNMERLKGGPSYIEIGGALGDQGLALCMIGLGELVGLWKAVTPEKLNLPAEACAEMAGRGLVMAGGFK